jgi:hypothetical protein
MKKLGIPASALIKATTNEPNATIIRDLQSALRARYEESDWLNVLKPINDEMRALQRDALVAYILQQMRANPDSAHIDTPDKLFEYFLMDVQMSPCMQTSRIRHALSSVQLFIERCLMNLEKNKVDPSSIKAKQWEWMKRYRVWEANRKVFLWPENWLEPELRDDQSPFFKEAMSELLQSDITEDSAAVVLLNYLSKLDEVAKLEPCGIHYLENDLGTSADNIAHVVARTAGANRKYFYRRREYGYWTPWEQIKLDIEDNPVIPMVWKGRLFLFWLRIIKQTLQTTQKPGTGDVNLTDLKTSDFNPDAIKIAVQAMLCWSEYYNGKWQPTKTSDVDKPVTLGTFFLAGDHAFDRSELILEVYEEGGSLVVTILGQYQGYVSFATIKWILRRRRFILYNTHSLPRPYEESVPGSIEENRTFYVVTTGDDVIVKYMQGRAKPLERSLLKTKQQLADRVIQPHQYDLQNGWIPPFFYEDRRHVFYITTTEQLVTIPMWNFYLPLIIPPKQDFIIPSLVFEQVPFTHDPSNPVISGMHMGVLDPDPIKLFVTEDAYIKKSISTTSTVLFGGTEIGAAGNRNPFQQR